MDMTRADTHNDLNRKAALASTSVACLAQLVGVAS